MALDSMKDDIDQYIDLRADWSRVVIFSYVIVKMLLFYKHVVKRQPSEKLNRNKLYKWSFFFNTHNRFKN